MLLQVGVAVLAQQLPGVEAAEVPGIAALDSRRQDQIVRPRRLLRFGFDPICAPGNALVGGERRQGGDQGRQA